MKLTTFGTGALAMAALGWRVFPLRPGGKQPLFDNPHPRGSAERSACRARCGRVGHGCWDATTDASVIAGWWSRVPSANVGVACGRPLDVPGDALSSPDVVDIDVKANAQGVPAPGLASLERLRRAGLVSGPDAIVSTASGGWHLYFAGTRQGNGTLRGYGVDFRSLGGYVVAPPSVVEYAGKPVEYGFARVFGMADPRPVDWEAIRRHLLPGASPTYWSMRPPGQPEPSSLTAAKLTSWLERQPEGNRNNGLHWVTCKAYEVGGPNGADPWVLDEIGRVAHRLGLDDTEIQRTMASARRQIEAKR